MMAYSGHRYVVDDLTNFLFANKGRFPGGDLIARNIQRGRDHGLPGYNDWRETCGMTKSCGWDDRPEEISSDSWEALKALYASPNDIDLFTAGIAEAAHDGGIIGRTFNCIQARQFQAMKAGDRFFFTNRFCISFVWS